jgi:hypothetical protein
VICHYRRTWLLRSGRFASASAPRPWPSVSGGPTVALSIYSDVKADELRAVGASLFG